LLITVYQSVIILSTSLSPSSLLVSSSDPETSRLSVCFSCASPAYLSLWNQLMHHYFPPKNFTDRCWGPDSEIGTVPCRGSCFILVEEIFEHCKFFKHGPENQIVTPIHAYKQYSTMQGLLLPNEFDFLVSFVPNVALL
uniref:Bromo domain-containing protein n=1 Tax=Brugia timori TaxID=42155 RepID=A0A0R3QWI5_9BILA